MSEESIKKAVRESMSHEMLRPLLEDVFSFVKKFLSASHVQIWAITLWVAHTYVYEKGYFTPYLYVHSAEKRSGKTLLLEILSLLVRNPWLTGRVSTAVLGRKISSESPTLLLDEADAAFGSGREYAEGVRGVLNLGFKQGGKTTVAERINGKWVPMDFNNFCPKAIALIGKLPGTLQDRSIDLTLKRKSRGEVVERFRERKIKPEADSLKDRLHNWAQSSSLDSIDVELPDELSDRAQDIWEILFQIAHEARGEWPMRVYEASLHLSGDKNEDPSLKVGLLTDISFVFESAGEERISSAELLKGLNDIDDSPWAEMGKNGLTSHRLSTLLAPFGIKSSAHRMGVDGKPRKGFKRSDFLDAWSRYVPDSDGNIGNKVESVPESPRIHVTGDSSGNDRNAVLLRLGTGAITPNSGVKPAIVTDVTDNGDGNEEVWEETL